MISINYQRKESSHSKAVFRLVSWQFTVVFIRTELIRRGTRFGEDGGTGSDLLNEHVINLVLDLRQ